MLFLTVALEDLTNGMKITALFAYQMTLVNIQYSTTQLALLGSIVHLGRVICSLPSGWIIENMGWSRFFLITIISNILILWLVYTLYKKTNAKGCTIS